MTLKRAGVTELLEALQDLCEAKDPFDMTVPELQAEKKRLIKRVETFVDLNLPEHLEDTFREVLREAKKQGAEGSHGFAALGYMLGHLIDPRVKDYAFDDTAKRLAAGLEQRVVAVSGALADRGL